MFPKRVTHTEEAKKKISAGVKRWQATKKGKAHMKFLATDPLINLGRSNKAKEQWRIDGVFMHHVIRRGVAIAYGEKMKALEQKAKKRKAKKRKGRR